MVTPRGWWFLFANLAMLVTALGLGVAPAGVLCLTLLVWFVASWLRFAALTHRIPRGVRVTREIRGAGGPTAALWARQTATVRIEVTYDGPRLAFARVAERMPLLAKWRNGALHASGVLGGGKILVLEYEATATAAGCWRFHGVRLDVADPQGFFCRGLFLRDPRRLRVLPPLVEGSSAPGKKHANRIPLFGAHRLRAPGVGSELLDLRDYAPSDPPKLIAWKPSAKRDRLIVRELENEVPVRCTLIVDASSSVRVGAPGQTALARVVEVAAAVLHTNAERRDLTGLTLIDEVGVGRVLRPARGQRAYYDVLHLLSDVADLPPAESGGDVDDLAAKAMGLAQDLFPDQLAPEVNRTPWHSPWFWFRSVRWRKKVSAILANAQRLGPGGVALLHHDDAAFRRSCARWLSEHRVALPTFLYDEKGRYRYRFPAKVDHLAKALLSGVSRGKDNELFVLIADLVDLETDLAPLVRAVRTARARKHQVQVVCPWPQGVPLPGEAPPPIPVDRPPLQEILNQAWTSRLHASHEQLVRALASAGVPPLMAPHEDTAPRILQRLDLLRLGASGAAGMGGRR